MLMGFMYRKYKRNVLDILRSRQIEFIKNSIFDQQMDFTVTDIPSNDELRNLYLSAFHPLIMNITLQDLEMYTANKNSINSPQIYHRDLKMVKNSSSERQMEI